MDQFIIDFIARGGYLGIALLMVAENVIPPIPSELIMGAGGMAMARGSMQFWPLLLAGTVGSTLGNYAWFVVCDRLGYERMKVLVDRWGRWLTVEWEDIEKTARFFRKHGHWAVFAVRMSPLMRTMISLPAGLSQMQHGKFLAYTFVGAAVWNAVLIGGGHLLADRFAQAGNWFGWIVLASTALGLVWWLYRVMTWKPRAA